MTNKKKPPSGIRPLQVQQVALLLLVVLLVAASLLQACDTAASGFCACKCAVRCGAGVGRAAGARGLA